MKSIKVMLMWIAVLIFGIALAFSISFPIGAVVCVIGLIGTFIGFYFIDD